MKISVEEAHAVFAARSACCVKQRQIVLKRGVCELRDLPHVLKIVQRCEIAALHLIANGAVEFDGPVVRLIVCRVVFHGAQVVDDIAAPDDE